MVSPGFRKLYESDVQQNTSDYDLFLVQVWFWEVLWSFFSVDPQSWLSLVVVYSRLFLACHSPMEK